MIPRRSATGRLHLVISGHFPAQPAPRQRVNLAAAAGMAASVLFVTGFISQAWLHPGYSWTAMFVSELSLGPNGWIQMLNFLLTGALLLVFGRGLRADFRTGAASRAGPLLMQLMAVCLMASGPFTTDPSTMPGQTTLHAMASSGQSSSRPHPYVASFSTGASAPTTTGAPSLDGRSAPVFSSSSG